MRLIDKLAKSKLATAFMTLTLAVSQTLGFVTPAMAAGPTVNITERDLPYYVYEWTNSGWEYNADPAHGGEGEHYRIFADDSGNEFVCVDIRAQFYNGAHFTADIRNVTGNGKPFSEETIRKCALAVRWANENFSGDERIAVRQATVWRILGKSGSVNMDTICDGMGIYGSDNEGRWNAFNAWYDANKDLYNYGGTAAWTNGEHDQTVVNFWSELKGGSIQLTKTSSNPNISNYDPNHYSLAGAVFGIYDGNGNKVAELTTDADGNTAKTPTLPIGTYTVKETKAPKGFEKCADFTVTVNGGQTTTQTVNEKPQTGRIQLDKKVVAGCSNIVEGNRMYSLEGAEFQVIDKNGNVADTLKTDKDGVTGTSKELAMGTYTIHETVAPEGYNLADDFTITVGTPSETSKATVDEIPYSDPLNMLVEKYDAESGFSDDGNTAQGSATLAGAEFTVEYYDTLSYDDAESLKKAGEKPTRTWTFKTDANGFCSFNKSYLVRGDDFYTDTLGTPSIPVGTIVVTETKAPKGYALGEATPSFQKISRNGEKPHTVAAYSTQQVPNQIIRGDFEFAKRDAETGKTLAGIPFKVTSKSTGESHVVVTDENGYFSSASAFNKHSNNTNGNDDTVAAANGADVDSSTLDATAGTWFGAGEADDSKAAFPYDTYTIEELPCTNNKGMNLISDEFTISRDNLTVDFGTLDDVTPEIHTSARDDADGDQYVGDGTVTIDDQVDYTHLVVGKEYTVKGELHDSKTGDAIKVDGKPVTAETKFTPTATSGSAHVKFTFDTADLDTLDTVVFERLYDANGRMVASHEDKDDRGQQITVKKPEIGTTATDKADGDKDVSIDTEMTIVDTVSYTNLDTTKEYTVSGTLMDKETGKAFEVDGKPVTASTTFTPEKADGTVDVTFTFDGTSLKDGQKLVAFEDLSRGGKDIVSHEDIDDEGQTVEAKKPEIGTTAKDGTDGDKDVSIDTEMTIVDTIAYKSLVVGKEYTVSGTLMDKETGKAFEVDGKPVTSSTTFTPEKADGTVDVTFTFDGTSLKDGQKLVAFEDLSRGGKDIVSHEDIDDEGQTVDIHKPSGHTTAKDGIDGDQSVINDEQVTVIDTVHYKSLVVGKEYTVSGTLMDKETGKAFEVDGKPVTASTTFTPEKSDGTVDVTFTFDASALTTGDQLVAFEKVERNGKEIFVHEDIEDKDQTITFVEPSIGTTATDKADGDKLVVADKQATITDTVDYANAIAGEKYTMAGILMDSATGLPILSGKGADKYTEDDLKQFMADLQKAIGTDTEKTTHVDAEAMAKFADAHKDILSHMVYAINEFTPEKSEGNVSMDFTFDANSVIDTLKGEAKKTVVFEAMFKGSLEDLGKDGVTSPKVVAVENDKDSETQTVVITPSSIRTTATDKADGDHTIAPSKTATVVDTISYENLIAGKEYTVKGTLMDKATGKPLVVGDQFVTAETRFTPNAPSGTVDVTFTFDASALSGHDLVAFEELHEQQVDAEGNVTDVTVAEHKDIEDKDQTVTVSKSPQGKEQPSGGTYGKTGLDMTATVVTVIVLAALGAAAAAYARKNRMNADEQKTNAEE